MNERKVCRTTDLAMMTGLPVQGPHWTLPQPALDSGDFVPLRLVLALTDRTIELTRADMIVGRHSEADIRLPLPDVSRRHCRLMFADRAWHVIDLNSLNGVFVNGQRVRQATLRHRDSLDIGGYTFEIDLRPGERTVQLPIGRKEPGAACPGTSAILPYPPATPDQQQRQAS